LTSYFDSTLTFEFITSFCQYLSVIVFDLLHLFCKKVRLQGFIKKCIIPEPSEINNLFLLYRLAKDLAAFLRYQRHFFYVLYAYCNFLKLIIKKCRKLHFFKWELPVLILGINVKLNFKAIFINIMYIYLQPFRRNFNFLIKILFFISNCFI
jgi:hypothetical protein